MAATRKDLPLDQARAALREHFSDYQGEKYAEGWAKLWQDGSLLPWDRGKPSPALSDTLENYRGLIGGAMVDGRRKRALVPGCGRGVDVLLLESFGYDAVGLEVSEGAVKAAEQYAEEHGNEYVVKDDKVGKGSRKFVHGDFYKNDFLGDAGMKGGEKFDLIYDYTVSHILFIPRPTTMVLTLFQFFCAMNPKMRPAWAQRMSELLADSSQANLICLEFPTDKPASSGGPPFGSPSKAYLMHLCQPGNEVPYQNGEPKFDANWESGPGALERVGYWHPADTHQVGKDETGNVKDYISVWRHR